MFFIIFDLYQEKVLVSDVSCQTNKTSDQVTKEMQTETIPKSDGISQTKETKTEEKLEILKELCTKFVEKLERNTEIMNEQASEIEKLKKFKKESEKEKEALAERVAALENRNSRLKIALSNLNLLL